MGHLCAVLVAGLLIAPAGAAARWPAPPFGNVVAQDLATTWLIPERGPVVTFAGGGQVDYSRRLGRLAIASRRRLDVFGASGRLLWSRRISDLAGAPRWSSARPVRLAFLAGHALRLVTGSGGSLLRLGRARDVAPAWRPSLDQVAFVRPDGEIVVAGGTGRVLARWRPGRMPVGLSWTGDAQHLVVSLRYSVVVLDPSLRPEWTLRTPAILGAVAAPVGTRFALLTTSTTASGAPVTTLAVRDAATPAFHARLAQAWTLGGRVVWSPDARSLIVARPVLRDWLLITVRTHRARRMVPPRGLPAKNGFSLPIAWR